MKLRFLKIMLCFLIAGNGYSQNEIRGIVLDQSNNPIAFANVFLTTPDDTTTIVSGVITDLTGEFRLAIPDKNNYLLFCSFVGFNTAKININTGENLDSLLVIKLESSTQELGEIVVLGQTIARDIEKTSYFITSRDRDRAVSSLSLFRRIPGIRTNETQFTISTMMGQAVGILINGRKASTIDLMALSPEQVIRIEHYQIPPARFMATGYSEIINVVTRQVIEGGNIYASLNHSFATGYGNYVLSGNYNRNRSQFSVNYSYSFRNYSNQITNRQFNFSTENDAINFSQIGQRSPFGYQMHIANINYVNMKESDYVFSIRASPNFTSTFNRSAYEFMRQRNSETFNGFGKRNSETYQFTPSVDIYFQKEFSGNREVLLNVVGNSFRSESNFIRTDISGFNNDTLFYQHIVNENLRQSLISEIQFSQRFTNSSFNLGIRSNEGLLRQSMFIDPFYGSYNMRTSELYAYGEFSGKINAFSFQGSLGLSFNSFYRSGYGSGRSGSYNFRTLRPVVNLFYQPAENSSLNFHYSKNPTLPSLDQLNDFKRPMDFDLLLVNTGNPNLKPFNTHYFSLTYNFSAGRVSSNLRLQYSNALRPILFSYVNENDTIKFSPRNEKSRNITVLSSFIRTQFFENDLLNITLFGSIVNFENNFIQRRSNVLGYILSVSANLNYRNFILDASFTNPLRTLEDESISIGSAASDISLHYRHNSFLFGFGVFLPFSIAYARESQTVKQSLVNSNFNSRIYDNGSMLHFRLTYNFSFGRQINWNRRINNVDSDTGIIEAQ